MASIEMKMLRVGLALLGTGIPLAAIPAFAQVQQTPYREDAGTALTRHLRTLSEQPRSLSALLGAGKAALELGDPQAALTFFARAEEIAPRDGYVKAGMGSAFVAMEQPRTALRLFTEAAGLGVAEAEFAGDRGLVHDLAGDPRRAQADYALALSRREDDEVRRRLALSLAISGDRDRALATIDMQLRRQDRAAWRTRAFILALAGDARGATQVAESTMPMQAAQLQPFFARLASLNPAQRAMAVHFGHFPEGGGTLPSTGTQYASAAPIAAAPMANATQAGRPDPRQAPLGTRRDQPAQVRSAPSANAAAGRTASRQAERRESRSNRGGLDWAERYGRPSMGTVARRPSREAAASPSRTGNAAVAQRDQARVPAQVQTQAQQRGAPANAGLLVRSPSPPSGPVTPPVQNAPTQLAEARPNASPTISTPGQPAFGTAATQPVQTSSIQTPSAQSLPVQVAQTGAAVPSPSAMASLNLPIVRTAPQPQPPIAAPVSSPALPGNVPAQQPQVLGGSPIAALALPPSEPAQQQRLAVLPAQSSETAPSNQQPGTRSFADIAAAVASLPVDAGGAASASVRQPERQVLARLEAPAEARASAASAQPDPEAPKPAAPAKAKPEPSKTVKADAANETASNAASAKKEAAANKEAAAKKEATTKKEAAAKEAAKKVPAAPKEASRHWVQIAGGANEAAMTSEFKRLKSKAPKLLGGRTAWTTPLRATNRLLVGPFQTSKEAQEFVNELAKLDLSAFSWTSPAGQEIAKLSAK